MDRKAVHGKICLSNPDPRKVKEKHREISENTDPAASGESKKNKKKKKSASTTSQATDKKADGVDEKEGVNGALDDIRQQKGNCCFGERPAQAPLIELETRNPGFKEVKEKHTALR